MGKRKADEPNSQAQAAAGSGPEKPVTPTADGAPPDALAKVEAPQTVPATPSAAAASIAEPVKLEAPPALDTAKMDTAGSAPAITPPTPSEPPAIQQDIAAAGTTPAPWMPSWLKMPQMPRFTPLAATVAIAAVAGALAGSIATAAIGGLWASPAPQTKTAEVRPVRDTITRINSELAALKASIENSGRTANTQLAKLGDRFDRLERAQAEPAARLAKLSEAVDRLERRTPAATAPHDITGSIATPSPQPAAAAAARPAGPPVIDGWVVRSVYNGAALIQARYGGVLEVEPGDNLPGLGRIENIRRQDGRWVVVTSRGMIVAR